MSRTTTATADGLQAILRQEATRPGAPSDPYHLFQEMEEKDGHLFAVLQTRKTGVLARDRRLVGAQNRVTPTAQRLAERALSALGEGLHGALLGLLDALSKGCSIVEVMWRVESDGVIVPYKLVPRWAGRFQLDPTEPSGLRRVDADDPPEGRAMPPRKFLVAVVDATPESPQGVGLCQRAYWYSWFKRHNLKSWLHANERFGAPTIIGRFPHGADQAERDRLLELIDTLQREAGVVLPEGYALEVLESQRNASSGASFRELCDWCNDEISKIVLGQTLTTSEGRRSGSLALGQVHDAIRLEYMEADARLLEAVINGQLLRWVIDLNLGTQTFAPQWRIDTTREERLMDEAEIDKALLGMGVPLGLDYFYDRYRRPKPAPKVDRVRYDDQNLFQYHLRFGVLTINEVRERLGYPSVQWGDKPVNNAAITAAEIEAAQLTAPPEHSAPGIGDVEPPQMPYAGRDSGEEDASSPEDPVDTIGEKEQPDAKEKTGE